MQESSYYVGWFALALINANIAQLKGRSGLGWFIGSLFLGPLVTFFLAIGGNRPTLKAAQRSISTESPD